MVNPCVCGATNWGPWSANRVCCRECGKTRSINYTRSAYQEAPLPKEVCPKCGVMQSPYRADKIVVKCRSCGSRYKKGAGTPESAKVAAKQTMVVTSAVNDCPAHLPFLKALEAYCGERDAQLVVIPLRYRNPTSGREDSQTYSWAPQVSKYLCESRVKVCQGLQILADIKTQPTAVNPLSGMDTITGQDCGIFGHTKVALQSIPTRGHELPKLLLTTGAVTKPKYSDSKAGKKGEFHHVVGAVVVEVDGDKFHLRHIYASTDGSFIDLDRRYTKDGSSEAPPAAALVLGDIHAERADPDVISAVREMQSVLRPKKLVLHDVLDFGSASHHNGFWEKFARRIKGQDRVAEELKITCGLIDSLYRKGQQTVIVSSNHNDHLSRWLADSRNGDDIQNAAIYHKAKSKVLSEIEKTFSVPNIFALVAKDILKKPAVFLGDRDSMTVAGIELAYHGDKGPNGARGSAKAFDKIGAKTVIGHSHSPAIVGGCFQTGTTSLLNMGYNVGPSSWLHSHVVIYANGKRSHIHVIDKSWRRAEKPKRSRKSNV